MKQYALKDRLYHFQWTGVALNVISVLLVGCTAILNETTAQVGQDAKTIEGATNALLGVTLVMLGAFVQAMQFVFEEKGQLLYILVAKENLVSKFMPRLI
jgi:hypothetical protein